MDDLTNDDSDDLAIIQDNASASDSKHSNDSGKDMKLAVQSKYTLRKKNQKWDHNHQLI